MQRPRLLPSGDAAAQVKVSEAMDRAKALFPQLQYREEPHEALRDADAAPVCTEWGIFRTLDWVRAGKLISASWSSTDEISIRPQSCTN
jgi:hypothetical protein